MIVNIYNKDNQFRKLINVAQIVTLNFSPNILDQPKLHYIFIEPDISYTIPVEDVISFEVYESHVVYDLLTNHKKQVPPKSLF